MNVLKNARLTPKGREALVRAVVVPGLRTSGGRGPRASVLYLYAEIHVRPAEKLY